MDNFKEVLEQIIEWTLEMKETIEELTKTLFISIFK